MTDYQADVHAHSDYYPFGSVMEERTGSAEGYRYGFQGQETDDEVYGGENTVSFKYRVHDARIGRFLSVDPLAPEYPWNSPYAFSENRVIDAVELEGLEMYRVNSPWWAERLYNMALSGATEEQLMIAVERARRRGLSMHPGDINEAERYLRENVGYSNELVERNESEYGDFVIYGTRPTPEGPETFTIIARFGPRPFEDDNSPVDNIEDQFSWDNFWGPGGGPFYLFTGETALPREYSREQGLSIGLATGSVVIGIFTLGSSIAAESVVGGAFSGVSILFGLDDIGTDENGNSYVERVWIEDDQARAYYNGAKSIFAFVGGKRTLIDLASNGPDALKVISLLNSERSSIMKALKAADQTQENSTENENE